MRLDLYFIHIDDYIYIYKLKDQTKPDADNFMDQKWHHY